jgi:hypothetical protein
VPNKLNDVQIAEIVMKHSNGTSISTLASDYNVGWRTIKRYLDNNKEMSDKCNTIKSETITQWLKDNTDRIQGLLKLCIDLLPEKLKEASARDIVGAYKILSETSVNNVESKQQGDDGDALDRLCKEIREASQKEQDDA